MNLPRDATDESREQTMTKEVGGGVEVKLQWRDKKEIKRVQESRKL